MDRFIEEWDKKAKEMIDGAESELNDLWGKRKRQSREKRRRRQLKPLPWKRGRKR